MCARFLAAVEASDGDRTERAVEDMLDIGTEDDPHATDPNVYVHALLIQGAIRDGDQKAFDASMEALIVECEKPSTAPC